MQSERQSKIARRVAGSTQLGLRDVDVGGAAIGKGYVARLARSDLDVPEIKRRRIQCKLPRHDSLAGDGHGSHELSIIAKGNGRGRLARRRRLKLDVELSFLAGAENQRECDSSDLKIRVLASD